ncbi:PPOX class F420-dependent oxidoreductase [Curtobacterium sp. MCBD17_003]|uniref:PPOX class F420-dependent oxidoreductase n=1 Tax=Curtobacterium sp. MCBD17_003 TaxID=2175667 RepID=UPI000DA70427|nr:PPOX class F420-dependent oxidoreductase [Curtobacterium sp. MCBD17_003]WIE55610.1 PPOX class F420-dependent oxidoreductase [Curtobacterium sp. MCBD17_003]
MSLPPLPDDAVAMLQQPNPAVIATLRSDGTPVTAATWYLWQDGRVLVSMDDSRVRLKHLRRDQRVSLTVLAEGDWYTHVTLIGRVVELYADDGLREIDRISTHYTGGAYPNQVRPRTTGVIEIDRWTGWGAMKDNDQPTT